MKAPDLFIEDRNIMTKEPMVDYSWVLHKWVPKGSRPDLNGIGGFAFSTEWNDEGDDIWFLVHVRSPRRVFTIETSMPRLETKAGKEAFRKRVCQELDRQIEARLGMERKGV